MDSSGERVVLRRVTGLLFVVGAVAFAVAATVLSSTLSWPDILREPADVVLPAFVAGGTSLVWTSFATAWTDAILIVVVLLLPAALGRRHDPVLRAASVVGAVPVVLSLIGFLRWCRAGPVRWGSSQAPAICSTRATSWPPPCPAFRSGPSHTNRCSTRGGTT